MRLQRSACGESLRQVFFLALLLVGVLPGLVGATLVVGDSDAASVDRATLIVEATVVGIEPAPFGSPGELSRTYRLAVHRSLKGQAPSGLMVRVPGGGSLNVVSFDVLAAPQFATGDRTVLFLEPVLGRVYRLRQLGLSAFRRAESPPTSEASPGLLARLDFIGDERRDWDAFVQWIADRVAGVHRTADYWREPGGLQPTRRRNFTFDTGFDVEYFIPDDGFDGEGTGVDQLELAMQLWNDDPGSEIRLRRSADSSWPSVVFEDTRWDLDVTFDCESEEPQILATGARRLPGGAVLLAGIHKGLLWEQSGGEDIVFSRGSRCYLERNRSRLVSLLASALGAIPLGLPPTVDAPDSLLVLPWDGRVDGTTNLSNYDRAAASFSYGEGAPLPETPAPPTGIGAVVEPDGSVVFSWTDVATNETAYVLEGHALEPPPDVEITEFAFVARIAADATTYRLAGVTPGRYRFRLRAENVSGLSSPSNNVDAEIDETKPSPPTEVWLQSAGLPEFEMQVEFEIGQGQVILGRVPVPGGCPVGTLCAAGQRLERVELVVGRDTAADPSDGLAITKLSSAAATVWLRRVGAGHFVVHRLGSANAAPGQTAPLPGISTQLPVEATERAPSVEAGPAGPWLSAAGLPGFSFKARFGAAGQARRGRLAQPCGAALACLGRADGSGDPETAQLLVRLLSEPGGWQMRAVRLTGETIRLWVRQDATGTIRPVSFAAIPEHETDRPGVLRRGFLPR